MARDLILSRQYCGIVTRIECMIRPLSGGQGLWCLLCAAGMDSLQPSEVHARGPYHGEHECADTLRGIVASLIGQGYSLQDGPGIWSLHLHRELRQQNASRGHPARHAPLPGPFC